MGYGPQALLTCCLGCELFAALEKLDIRWNGRLGERGIHYACVRAPQIKYVKNLKSARKLTAMEINDKWRRQAI